MTTEKEFVTNTEKEFVTDTEKEFVTDTEKEFVTDTEQIITQNGFHVERKVINGNIQLTFIFGKSVKESQFAKFLGLLDKFVTDFKEKQKAFLLFIDARRCSNVPIKASLMLSAWMKKRKPDFPSVLLGFAVVIDSTIIVSLINAAFHIQKPVSKHIITKNYEKARLFLSDIVK